MKPRGSPRRCVRCRFRPVARGGSHRRESDGSLESGCARRYVSAGSGVLEIDDGGETKRVELDRANLSSGSFVYDNASGPGSLSADVLTSARG